jgi:pSer/pThr/pTyr-binding forkhead associated (FHA) protein
MQDRFALRHVSGSRANRVDRLALSPEGEIILGRDPECHVRYSEKDELVSRKHLKIVASGESPVRYMAVDLGSRNGTFVNRQRVFGALVLSPGARVQLGAGGPEFEFLLDTESERGLSRKSAGPEAARSRRIDMGRRVLLMSLPVAAAAVGAAGYLSWPRIARLWEQCHQARPMPRKSTFDPHAALASLVNVDATWGVLHKPTHARLARAYIANERVSGAEHVPLIENAAKSLPAFVLQPGGRIEPLLVPAGNLHAVNSVAGAWKAKGVIVPQSATALIAAPVPLPWDTPYQWPAEESAGALLVIESARIKDVVPLANAQFPRWVPFESGWLADSPLSDLHDEVRGRLVSRDELSVELAATVGGSNDRLNMTMPNGSTAILAAPIPSFAALHVGRLPQVADASIPPTTGQSVWVVGETVESAQIQEVSPDGRIRLRASRCAEGGVFDREGRVVALCIPEAHPGPGGGSAIPLGRALGVSIGGDDGQGR